MSAACLRFFWMYDTTNNTQQLLHRTHPFSTQQMANRETANASFRQKICTAEPWVRITDQRVNVRGRALARHSCGNTRTTKYQRKLSQRQNRFITPQYSGSLVRTRTITCSL